MCMGGSGGAIGAPPTPVYRDTLLLNFTKRPPKHTHKLTKIFTHEHKHLVFPSQGKTRNLTKKNHHPPTSTHDSNTKLPINMLD